MAHVRLLRPRRQVSSPCSGEREDQKELSTDEEIMSTPPQSVYVPPQGRAFIPNEKSNLYQNGNRGGAEPTMPQIQRELDEIGRIMDKRGAYALRQIVHTPNRTAATPEQEEYRIPDGMTAQQLRNN